jgi:acetyl-CoA carboxylase biotin carboxyl carrier protein
MEYADIKKLMDDMGESKLDSIDIEFPDGIKISMTKNNIKANSNAENNVVIEEKKESTEVPKEVEIKKEEPISNQEIDNTKIVKSPMVGTFYSASSPDTPSFVNVGDTIKKGDTLCIIEAMKLMNEIESEYDGEVVEIFVKNEDMVEYGMPLFRVK